MIGQAILRRQAECLADQIPGEEGSITLFLILAITSQSPHGRDLWEKFLAVGKKLNNLHGINWVFAFVFMVGNSLARPQTHPQKRLVVFWQPSIRLDSIEDGSLFSIRNIDK